MVQDVLKILLIDDGMNTGISTASKIGGGQVARRRFFADPNLFKVTVLTSENEIAIYWDGVASIIYEPNLKTYRPTRIYVTKHKIKLFSLIKNGFRAAKILKRYLDNGDDDVVFLNDNKSRMIYILVRLLNRQRKKPACAAIQIDGVWKVGAFDFFLKYFYMLTFDKIICPTNAAKRALGVAGRLFSLKIFTAYSGVEVPDISKINTNSQRKISECIIFGCIGTLRSVIKGQDIIINAVHRLIQKNGHMPFIVNFYGDGPDRRSLEKMIKEYDLKKYFNFKGYVSKHEQIYSQIDACIVASRTEAGPIVIMESLVRNIPVISSDLDACKELISNFYDNLFFEQGNDQALALKLDSVLKGEILDSVRERIGNADKHIITRDYQVKRVYRFLSTCHSITR
jgi:glycosyltransferase involved in cell wall biosynthesis